MIGMGLDILPLIFFKDYTILLFQDYHNIFGKGHNAIYIHCTPYRQYILKIADSWENYLKL